MRGAAARGAQRPLVTRRLRLGLPRRYSVTMPNLLRLIVEPYRRAPRTRHYALANAVVWTLYALINLSVVIGVGKLTPGVALLMAMLSLNIFLAEHWLFGLARVQGWYEMSPFGAAVRLLPVIGALSLAVALVTHGVGQLMRASDWVMPDEPLHGLAWQLLPAINIAILLVLVTAVDFGVQSVRRLREREVAQWKTEAALKAAELRQLKTQINPHFTFNALNNIRALISEDPQRARQSVTHLAEVLRYVLYHAERESVTLEQELEVVTAYLALEAIQQEQRLRLDWRIAPDAQTLKLPPMTLQILVENAIKHGIARRPEGGTLCIAARREGDALSVDVSNPGRLGETPTHGGVGLAYLRERLRHADGGDLTLRQEGEHVTATLRVPQPSHDQDAASAFAAARVPA